MSIRQLVEHLRQVLFPPPPPPPQPVLEDEGWLQACWEQLTPRQQEVAALICLGYTNPQIAGMLFISSNTVHTHSRSIQRVFQVAGKTGLRVLLANWDFSEFASLAEARKPPYRR